VLDPTVPDEQVRPQIFKVVPEVQLQEVYDDSGAKARPEDGQTFDLLLNHYSFLRKFLPDLIGALEFSGTSAAQPVVQAIAALKQMDLEDRRTLPKAMLFDFLPADWRTAVEAARASKDPKERRRAKRLWELGLAEQMRKLLRSSDLSVPGSRQHKVWTSYLHTEAAWAERESSWFARHSAHKDAKAYLNVLEERYQTLLQTMLDGWDTNDFA